jgi:hypothetical protein
VTVRLNSGIAEVVDDSSSGERRWGKEEEKGETAPCMGEAFIARWGHVEATPACSSTGRHAWGGGKWRSGQAQVGAVCG